MMLGSRPATLRLASLSGASPPGAIDKMRRFSARFAWARIAYNIAAFLFIMIFGFASSAFRFSWTLAAILSSLLACLLPRQAPQKSEEASITPSHANVDVQFCAEPALVLSPRLQFRCIPWNPPSLAPLVCSLPPFDTVDDNTPAVCPSDDTDKDLAEVFAKLTFKSPKKVRFAGDDDELREPQNYRMYPRDGPPNVFLDPADNEDNLRWAQVGAYFRAREKRWKKVRKARGRAGFLKKYDREWSDEKYTFPGAFDYGKNPRCPSLDCVPVREGRLVPGPITHQGPGKPKSKS